MIPTPCSSQDCLQINHTAKGIVQTLVKLWQSCCLGHFHREPVSVTNHLLGEQPFPNVQPELPLMQFHSTSLYSITGHVRKENSTSPATAAQEGVVDCEKVTSQLSLPQTQQGKRSQPFLTSLVLKKITISWKKRVLSCLAI